MMITLSCISNLKSKHHCQFLNFHSAHLELVLILSMILSMTSWGHLEDMTLMTLAAAVAVAAVLLLSEPTSGVSQVILLLESPCPLVRPSGTKFAVPGVLDAFGVLDAA